MCDPPSWGLGFFWGVLCLFFGFGGVFGFLFRAVWYWFGAGLLLDGLVEIWCMMCEFRFGSYVRVGNTAFSWC